MSAVLLVCAVTQSSSKEFGPRKMPEHMYYHSVAAQILPAKFEHACTHAIPTFSGGLQKNGNWTSATTGCFGRGNTCNVVFIPPQQNAAHQHDAEQSYHITSCCQTSIILSVAHRLSGWQRQVQKVQVWGSQVPGCGLLPPSLGLQLPGLARQLLPWGLQAALSRDQSAVWKVPQLWCPRM